MTIKICKDCKNPFPLISGFPKHPTSKDGYSNLCHECKYAAYLPWRKKNVRSRPGYLYIFKAMDDMYKIGISKREELRLQGMRAQSPVAVEMFYNRYFENSSIVETRIHDMCKEYHSHFEWFKIPSDVIQSIINMLEVEASNEQI